MTALRCAIYARYSTDRQSEFSIADQSRNCERFAAAHGHTIPTGQVYYDEAMSGVGTDRPGLTNLLKAACSPHPPFDAVLIDDTNRLSRSTQDVLSIYNLLNFKGIQLIAVSQGIDSRNDQSELLLTMHGLVDGLYVKELAKKTHRGLEGNFLRGFHTGGRCFGYVTVEAADGKRIEILESEAAVVRRIFEMSASGDSLKRSPTRTSARFNECNFFSRAREERIESKADRHGARFCEDDHRRDPRFCFEAPERYSTSVTCKYRTSTHGASQSRKPDRIASRAPRRRPVLCGRRRVGFARKQQGATF